MTGRYERHGGKGTPLYNVWTSMRARCNRRSDPAWANYGGRGIGICAEWESFAAFRGWAQAQGYGPGLTLERIDNDGHYEPGNCRWTARTEQANNKRNSRRLAAFGEVKTLAEWSRDRRCVVGFQAFQIRIQRRWPVELALTAPADASVRRRRGRWTYLGLHPTTPGWHLDDSILVLDRQPYGGSVAYVLQTGPLAHEPIDRFLDAAMAYVEENRAELEGAA